ncbi:glycerol-3-phosphate responsive antiterminator [Lutibacter sp. B2]|nr:glycerol-3-phosphate responsive antiterminator [Lutibacter sp. B2]
MESHFYNKISNNPIIAAVSDLNKLEAAINSPCEMIFLLGGNIFNLKQIVDRVHEAEMEIYVHLDLVEGFSREGIVLKYIKENINPNGIITTKSNLIKSAKELDLFVIQRLFLLDSLSLDTGIKSIKHTRPDAIEILPGVMPKITKIISKSTNIPIITGGLIKDKEDVIASLKAGAMGISTTKEEIWYM